MHIHVVTWQLLCHTGKGTPVHDAYFGQGTGRIYHFQCQITESTLNACYSNYDTVMDYWNDHDCLHSEDAGVICKGDN